MNHLLRELAPISGEGWEAIDQEASRTLRHFLAARKVVDFSGPHGWAHSAETLGRVAPLGAAPSTDVDAAIRQLQPLAELRTLFELSRRELEAIDRGSRDYDLQVVVDAARQAAIAEDSAVFHGYDAAGFRGISESSPHAPVVIADNYNEYPGTVARAVATLQAAGIGGPFTIALGPRCYTGVIETTEHGGYPVFEHIRVILGGPVVLGAGGQRRDRRQLARRRLPAHVWTRLLHRISRPRRRQRPLVPRREPHVPRAQPRSRDSAGLLGLSFENRKGSNHTSRASRG